MSNPLSDWASRFSAQSSLFITDNAVKQKTYFPDERGVGSPEGNNFQFCDYSRAYILEQHDISEPNSTMVSVSTVQPSLNQEFLCTYLENL